MSPQDWSRLRIGDTERDQAAAALADHFAEGRLDHDEYSQRLDAAWSAHTRADLDLLFHDLPRPVQPAPAPSAARRRRGVPTPLLVALVVIGVVVVVANAPSLLVLAGLLAFISLRRRRRYERWLDAAQHHPALRPGALPYR